MSDPFDQIEKLIDEIGERKEMKEKQSLYEWYEPPYNLNSVEYNRTHTHPQRGQYYDHESDRYYDVKLGPDGIERSYPTHDFDVNCGCGCKNMLSVVSERPNYKMNALGVMEDQVMYTQFHCPWCGELWRITGKIVGVHSDMRSCKTWR